ncbi:MAG: RNA-binding protein [Phenylobacterium sp.]|uniref:RNA-binding protein n=1 Tax=Phenylobacterium ferrooxidans TaxID=2982689 RepID=A0ABW6CXY1_9CAUL|nr:RNA-binding protein [Phenylobacterium sp.]MDO8324962.1 RNA-binding protein [Phenylobacterium sp.]MDO8913174.1 RNA-binding protein [Phenylobacterium sp.]MDP2010819.1 RNA-binding protein [Phenylobacterium sp.]MDP3100018.1 RNA-binding protein [Phenylobacterium sp.]MDP3635546.1 RNA-binding protein [Phenylobacterium sp.]
MTASTVPTTLAQVARERRDIVTGEVMAEERLIRFVAGPGGVVVPDLARKLPGRGMWVAADRASVETAARKGLFSRSAKAKLSASPDLADQVDSLLRRRVLDGLGLAKRAGDLISGYEKVAAALNAGRAAWVIEAADGAQDGRRKILNVARKSPRAPKLLGLYSNEELGLALGGENVIHTAFLAGRGADQWTFDVHRLSGFRPLLPESWREEP